MGTFDRFTQLFYGSWLFFGVGGKKIYIDESYQICILQTPFKLAVVQANHNQISSGTNFACNINSTVTILASIMMTAMNSMKSIRGWNSQFFVTDLGRALAPKLSPDQLQAFKDVNNSQAFAIEWRKNYLFFFPKEPLRGAPRHICTKFSANRRRTDCVVDQY